MCQLGLTPWILSPRAPAGPPSETASAQWVSHCLLHPRLHQQALRTGLFAPPWPPLTPQGRSPGMWLSGNPGKSPRRLPQGWHGQSLQRRPHFQGQMQPESGRCRPGRRGWRSQCQIHAWSSLDCGGRTAREGNKYERCREGSLHLCLRVVDTARSQETRSTWRELLGSCPAGTSRAPGPTWHQAGRKGRKFWQLQKQFCNLIRT